MTLVFEQFKGFNKKLFRGIFLALFLKLILMRFCTEFVLDMAQELFYKFILMLQVYIAQDEWF